VAVRAMRRSTTFALALFGLLLAVSLAGASLRSAQRIWAAAVHAGETPLEERSRIFDPVYVQRIEEIRRTLPSDAVYAIADFDPFEQGSTYWVRFDLAPRRAVFLGSLQELSPRLVRERMVRDARWVIVTSFGRPPELYPRHEFLQKLREGGFR